MNRTVVSGFLAVATVLVTVILVSGSHDDGYTLRMKPDNAGGLRDGSPVVIGGAQVGTVALSLDKSDHVEVDLKIDSKHAPLGRGTRAAISAVNLLGQKRVQLSDTDTHAGTAPSGHVLPSRQVVTSTDLDQVLSVLDTSTRARLTILLNEAGAAFTGRRDDLNELLGSFPSAMRDAQRLLENVVTDNSTLGAVLDRSERVIGELSGRRREVSRLLDTVGQTAATVSVKREALRSTLARAPQTVAMLRGFLVKLRAATKPLGPAARDITATAPELSRTLDELEPFAKVAGPALDRAVAVAPSLSSLATGATPVLRNAVPTATALARLATSAKPVGTTLDNSADNIIAVVDNWSKAVQFRDGLSHIFRGEASVSPDLLQSVIDRLTAKASKKPKAATPATSKPAVAPVLPTAPSGKPPSVVPKLPVKLPDVAKTVGGLLDKVTGLLPKVSAGQSDQRHGDRSNGLLDFLLGSGSR